nr:MAG TPA: hypothetical protein [Caudoviricetes sp.]
MAKNNTQITSLQNLKTYTKGQIVELPPFAEGMPFVARLRRPSMLALVKSGKIPNELLKTANDLFMGRSNKSSGGSNTNELKEMFTIFDALCEASFVEPTWEEIKESGMELTDDQYTFIFNYSQQGVKALKPFRSQSTGS